MLLTSGSGRATERGGQVMATRLGTRAATVREQAQARGLSAATRAAQVKAAQRAATAVSERGFRSFGSRARALRKYACQRTQNGKLCMREMKWGAPRQLQEWYGARGSKR
eukprot:6214740-Pleurochrysis_carterae.AAC.6